MNRSDSEVICLQFWLYCIVLPNMDESFDAGERATTLARGLYSPYKIKKRKKPASRSSESVLNWRHANRMCSEAYGFVHKKKPLCQIKFEAWKPCVKECQYPRWKPCNKFVHSFKNKSPAFFDGNTAEAVTELSVSWRLERARHWDVQPFIHDNDWTARRETVRSGPIIVSTAHTCRFSEITLSLRRCPALLI